MHNMSARSWIALTLLVALALPAWAAAEIQAEEYVYADGENALKGYIACDDDSDEKRPGVVIFPEWWGVNDYVKMRARQLASLGYVALVADVYGGGKATEDPEQAARWAQLYKGDAKRFRQRARLALEALEEHDRVDDDKLAAIGYCFGGTAALELARSGADVQIVVSFHGGLGTTRPAERGDIQAMVLVCHGAADPHVSEKEVQAFKKEMAASGADWQMNTYGSAVHSFTNPDAGDDASDGVAYHATAAARAWADMKTRLRETIGLPNPDAKDGGGGIGRFAKEKIVDPAVKAGKVTGKAAKKAGQWIAEKVTGN